jgi:hypothetical protein
MKNKILVVLALASFIIVLINLGLVKAESDLCSPEIKLVNQDPIPAIPDSYVKIIFEVSNLDNCNGFAVKLNLEYPFSLDPLTDPIQTIEKSPYAQDYKTVFNIPYKIRVASDALEGDYSLKLKYHETISKDFDYFSIEKGFNITVTDVQTNFDAVLQETSGTQVSIGIVNTGKNTANSLVVKIPQQESFRTTGTSEQIVGNLAAGDYSIVSFNVASKLERNVTRLNNSRQYSNQEPMLKVQIDYTDGIGKRRTVIKEIPMASSLLQQGNFTIRNLNGQTGRSTSTSNSGTSIWWYVIILAAVIGIGFIVYQKYGEQIKNFYQKSSFHEKISKTIPDWVLAERTYHKK